MPVGKDDDISGTKLDRLSIGQLDECCAVDHEMVDHQVGRSWCQQRSKGVGCRRRKTPGCRKLGAEEQCAVQLDSTQNLGECIHSALRTAGEVFRPDCKATSIDDPPEQFIGTLGHGCNTSC